jgi:hypothetical protein
MTLELSAPPQRAALPARRRPAPRPPAAATEPGNDLVIAAPQADPDALDAIAKRFYASAAAGIAIAAAAAAALEALGWPFGTVLGKMLGALLVLGITMFTGGGIAGSARPRNHPGGER